MAAPPSAFARRHPRETARLLDELTAALRPAATAGEDEPEPVNVVVSLPAATPPDKADAVDWLLKQTEPLTLLVDGYNLSFLLEAPGDFSTADARRGLRRLVARLARIRRMAMAVLRVIVVFDTRNEPSSGRRRGGIEVRFAASGDDEVVRLAESIDGTVVVVSNDREVRERSRRCRGAHHLVRRRGRMAPSLRARTQGSNSRTAAFRAHRTACRMSAPSRLSQSSPWGPRSWSSVVGLPG